MCNSVAPDQVLNKPTLLLFAASMTCQFHQTVNDMQELPMSSFMNVWKHGGQCWYSDNCEPIKQLISLKDRTIDYMYRIFLFDRNPINHVFFT